MISEHVVQAFKDEMARLCSSCTVSVIDGWKNSVR